MYSLFDDPFDPSPHSPDAVLDAAPRTVDPAPESPVGGGGAGSVGLSSHEVLRRFPGAIILGELTDEHRAELEVESARRGVLAAGLEARKVRRSAAEAAALDEFCMWLNRYGFDIFFSVTYSARAARELRIQNDYLKGITAVGAAARDMRYGLLRFGYPGRFGIGAEITDREIPHVHGVLSSAGLDRDRLLGTESKSDGELWRYFFKSRGRCRFELMRDQDDATLYALKDTFKNSTDPQALLLRMRPKHIARNARAHLSEQEHIFATRSAKRRRLAAVDE